MSMGAVEPSFQSSEPPALRLRDVGKSLGGRVLLSQVCLTIARGQIYGLLGPNGSGKTTLLRVLAGIWRADAGSVERPNIAIDRIGYVPQRFCLYDELTVHENLRFQARMRGLGVGKVSQVLGQFALEEFTGRRAASLSGGQRQRLLLAAAMIHRPALLLLDEPTTALDAASRESLWALLRREAAAGTTVVLTSHERVDAAACDASTELLDGRMVPAAVRA